MAKKPTIPVVAGGPPLGNVETSDSYLRIKQSIQSLRAGLDEAIASANNPRPLTSDQLKQIQQALQAGGPDPLNLTGLLGILAQPQPANIPEVSVLPNIAQSSDGQVVLYRKVIWRFSGKTHRWTPASTILLVDYSYNLVNYLPALYAPGVLFLAFNTGTLYVEEDLVVSGVTTPTWVPLYSETVTYPHVDRTSTGAASVASANNVGTVTRLSGPDFRQEMVGRQLWYNGNLYPIASVANNNVLALSSSAGNNANANYVFEFPSVDYPIGAEFYETDRTVSYVAQNANGFVSVSGNNVTWVAGVQFDVYWKSIRIGNNNFGVVSVAQNRQVLVVDAPPGNNNNSAYVVDRGAWFFKSGKYSDILANIPTDLDPLLDLGTEYAFQAPPYGGFRFVATDYRHTYWWTPSNNTVVGHWDWAPEDSGAQYIVASSAVAGPDGGYWAPCDGNTYLVALSSGTAGNVQTPNLTGGAFLRAGSTNLGNQNPANAATWAAGAHTDPVTLNFNAAANSNVTGDANLTTVDENMHTHNIQVIDFIVVQDPITFNPGNSNATLNYNTVLVSVTNPVTEHGSPHNHGVSPNPHNHSISVGGNITPNPHNHNLTNNNATLNPPSDANHGLPINVNLLWWMRR